MFRTFLMQHINHKAVDEVLDAVVYMIDFAPMVFTPLICGCLLGLSLGVIYQGLIDLHKFYLEWK